MSIDDTDFWIPQQGPALPGNLFSSHKFKGKCALRYEIGVDIVSGNIAWIEGPYAAGKYPDINIFRLALAHWLDPYERVEADDGYIGESPHKVKCPGCAANPTENLLKNWEILKQVYRHDIIEHGDFFRAVAVITQLSIENGEPLFEVDYTDL